MDIANSVALVTGGNRGIGEAFVRAFLAAGARRVYVGTRRVDAAAHLVAEAPERVVAVELDVTNEASIARAARECEDVTILVNNAGQFFRQTLLKAPDLSSARMEMEVNYFGPLGMCRAFAPSSRAAARAPSRTCCPPVGSSPCRSWADTARPSLQRARCRRVCELSSPLKAPRSPRCSSAPSIRAWRAM